MFDKFKAIYVNDDKIVEFVNINDIVLESQTMEKVGMENEAHIECFNFLIFFSSRDLAENDGWNIYVHFGLRLAVTELLDEVVGVLCTNNIIAKIVGDDDKGNVDNFPPFMVKKPGIE